MTNFELQQLRDLPIEEVAGRLGLQVTRHKCLCPFHDDHHASLSFNTRRNTYRCFVCGEHGGTIDLVMRSLHKDFLDACRWLDPSLMTQPPLSRGVKGLPVAVPIAKRRIRPGCVAPSSQPQPSPPLPQPPLLERGGRRPGCVAPSSQPQPSFDSSRSPSKLEGVADQREDGGVCPSPHRTFDVQRYERFFQHPWLSTTASANSPSKLEGVADQREDGGVCQVPHHPFTPSRYERFFQHPWLSPAARHFLFTERRLDPRVIQWCRLTSWRDRQGTDWLQIPYYSSDGRLIGIQNRNLTKDAQPRFRFPTGSQCSIYNLPVINRLQHGEALYITEGASDCWAMLSAGHKAVAIPSATLLKPQDVEQLSIPNFQLSIEYHMFPDRDEPGERLFLQLQKILPNLIHHHLPPNCKDFSEYYLQTKNKLI